MTTIYYREYYDKFIISIEGHAGYSTVGDDIVCAAVSTLCYTLLNCLLDEDASENIKLTKNIVSDGYMYFEFKHYDFSKQRVMGIVDTIIKGFLMLEESFPQYIKSV